MSAWVYLLSHTYLKAPLQIDIIHQNNGTCLLALLEGISLVLLLCPNSSHIAYFYVHACVYPNICVWSAHREREYALTFGLTAWGSAVSHSRLYDVGLHWVDIQFVVVSNGKASPALMIKEWVGWFWSLGYFVNASVGTVPHVTTGIDRTDVNNDK